MDMSTVQCGNPDCRISETGKCVEGLSTDTCPNFGKPPASVDLTDAEDAETDVVVLSPATKLSLEEAAIILRREESRVLAIVGPFDAGKTSLIAGMYDLFQKGPIQENYFRGSETLHAFETSCHDSRAASERSIPDINRTPLGEVEFFQIGVTQQECALRVSLLIGDRAGEDYRSATNDVQIVSSFHEVQRADTLTFLVDGNRLAQSVTRHQVQAELLRLVQALVDGGGTSPCQRVAIVLTKLDDIRASENSERAIADFEASVAKIRGIFAERFVTIEPFRVAASPKNALVTRGAGLAELLNFWLLPKELAITNEFSTDSSERVYGRLKVEDAL
jgi:hypothetical protein